MLKAMLWCTQGNQTLMAPRIEGNTKTTEYRTVGGLSLFGRWR